MENKNKSLKGRKAFTDKLYAISDEPQFKSNYERYLAMGQKCNLIDYFSGSEQLLNSFGVNYFFIALNVEAPAVESGASPIIPFFSIKKNERVDDRDDRILVINTAKNAAKDDFLTCPEFMNGENGIGTLIEKIVFEFSIKNGRIDRNTISIIKISTVDDNEVTEGTIKEFLNSSMQYKETFFDSWSQPIGIDGKIYCSVRAVDRDKDYKSHSIFVSMCDNIYALEKWVPIYGEDAMNIIATLKRIFIEDMKKKQRAEATKSAKAAIMSRNMSHNLGSHVMAYLKQKLGSVTSIMKEENKVLDNLIPDSIKKNLNLYLKDFFKQYIQTEKEKNQDPNSLITKFIENIKPYIDTPSKDVLSDNNEENQTKDVLDSFIDNVIKGWEPTNIENVDLPFLVGLGRFINYLQERQDYIATISTDYIPYGAPVNLKDAIYDELNPDLRYLRHHLEADNDAKNKPSNILLNYIAKSEGLSRENMKDEFKSDKDIRIGFIDYSSDKPQVFGINTFGDKTDTAFDTKNVALTQMRKINFSLPGGLVGRQAIFSIFENLIRNAAKHGDTSEVTNLDITLDVIDGSDIAWDVAHRTDIANGEKPKVIKWTDRVHEEKWRKLFEKAPDLDDLYLLTITDNLPCNNDVINNLKKGLYEDYVDAKTGQMTTANKGIKEIRISAAWIRGVTDEDCYLKYEDNTNGNTAKKLAPLVAVELSADGHLRYIVCIRKNKTVAIVSKVNIAGQEEPIPFDKDALEKFENLRNDNKDRWTILTDEELKNSKTSYGFVLCPDDDKAFNALRPCTSNRLCRWKINEESNKALDEMDKEDKTLMFIYRLFTGINPNSADIFIADGRAKKANNDREEISEGKKWKHFDKIRFDGIECSDTQEKYLYRTHYATEKEYIEFYSKHINNGEQYDCIEGITGDNSSDRLIRREPLDEKWYYTHLYALQKKVAIIDERIFKMVHGIDEKLFVGDRTISIDELKPYSQRIDITNLKKRLLPLIAGKGKVALLKAKSFDDIGQIVKEVPRKFIEDILDAKDKKGVNEDKTVLGCCHLTPYYNGKSVDVYNVVKDSEGNMVLVGCVKTEFDKEKRVFKNTFEKLATFKPDDKEDQGFVLEPISTDYRMLFADRYDYISIHQGILDKIYENLDIKNKDAEKCKLTSCIHQCLMRDKTIIGEYLPCFIIHSGRAKPTKEDMPQEQPFVQYAAIENAVKDCKPMLVELLDFAKYESANN